MDERGEIACSIIAATYAGCRGWEQGRDRRRGEVVEGRGWRGALATKAFSSCEDQTV